MGFLASNFLTSASLLVIIMIDLKLDYIFFEGGGYLGYPYLLDLRFIS